MIATRIALIGCGKEKREGSHAARELYTGQLFRSSLAHAEEQGFDSIFVLSAKHGLLELDTPVDSYDLALDTLSPEERAEWAHQVAMQLHARFEPRPLELHVFAGSTYLEPLRWQLAEFPGWAIEAPLEGLQIGQRLQWLKLQRRAA